jgi:hypothetical protein
MKVAANNRTEKMAARNARLKEMKFPINEERKTNRASKMT